jgi:hypothetical protein
MAMTNRTSLLLRLLDLATWPATAPWEGGVVGRVELVRELAAGTGSGQADAVGFWSGTIALGATQSIDLSGGSQVQEADGSSPVFVKIKGLALQKLAGSGTVALARPAANGTPIFAADSDELAPLAAVGDTVFLWYGDTGITVTAATGDLLSLIEKGGAASVSCVLLVIGTTA